MRRLLTVLLAVELTQRGAAFAPPTNRRRGGRRPPVAAAKNPFDEILDALDAMVGVSPLSESDLKADGADLEARARDRAAVEPPADALEKPSVAVFFFALGAAPVLLLLAGVLGGARPFNL